MHFAAADELIGPVHEQRLVIARFERHLFPRAERACACSRRRSDETRGLGEQLLDRIGSDLDAPFSDVLDGGL